jgi:hexosaminidase
MKAFKALLSVIVLVAIFFGSCNRESVFLPVEIIPEPISVEERGGYFKLNSSIEIYTNGDAEEDKIAHYFQEQFALVSGYDLAFTKIEDRRNDQGIIFELLPGADSLGDEGYLLNVKRRKIELSAHQPAGLFRGVQTLFQLMPHTIYGEILVDNIDWKVPRVIIYDKPRYAWRGMHLDVSRHFFPKEFILRYIDMIAMHKMNVFHWHLTDDNGWRIEIEKYPKLTEIGAWHVDREDMPWREVTPPEPGEEATYGGFYTKDEVREVVQYAAIRHITVLPEIEMPGHTSEVLAAYPELSCTGGPFYVQPGSYWPNIDIFCAGNEQTFEFLEGVLDEVIELFPIEYVHIGGDEATKTNWENCKKCQKRIKDEGLANEHELQSWFIKRMEKYLNSEGKKLIGWDEILEGGLAPEATVMSWRGFDGGIESARQGHDVVMSPVSHCYFDYYQANPDFEPVAIGGFTTLKMVYGFDPTPPVLNTKEAKHILGGQGNVWTEYIPTPEHAEYMSTPRMTALAEVLWSPKEKLDWDSFRERLNYQFDRFDAMGINYSEGSYAVDFVTDFDEEQNQFVVKMESEQYKPDIRFTIDGNDPTPESQVYTDPLTINTTTTIKAGIFEDGKLKETFSEKTIVFHQGLGAKVKYKSEPNFRYPGQGEQTLVDGLKGTKNHRTGLWQGFQGDDLEITIDLGSVKPISRVSATFFQRERSWIFLPKKFEVSYSEDGDSYSRVKTLDNPIPPKTDGAFIEEFGFDLTNANARFVKVKASNLGVCPEWHDGAGGLCWLFVDEVVVE